MIDLPRGTVTFLSTDLEGSTRLWEEHFEAMQDALARHDAILRAAVADHSGVIFKHTGDGVFAAFPSSPDALRAALTVWHALDAEPWRGLPPLRARMALYTGVAQIRNDDYFGSTLNRCARLLATVYGGQIVCSRTAAELCRDDLPDDVELADLGEHRLRDLTRPERVFEVRFPGQKRFPPLRSLDAFRHNLPQARTTFVGREQEIEEVGHRVEAHRLVTLVGIGGAGKTRLALQVAGDLVPRFPAGVFFIELAALTEALLVVQAVATAVGMVPDGSGANSGALGRPLEDEVVRFLRDQRVLLVLDNCEHVIDACARLADRLLDQCASLHLLATSRERLGVQGEHVWQVPPLALPAPGTDRLDDLVGAEAVRLFEERAAAHAGFALTAANASAVARICERLDGIPLAVELAAARTRHLDPQEILDRLNDRFRLLTDGGRTVLPRQQTLRATMDWSHQLLDEPEQVLLRRLAVFIDGFTLAATEAICAGESLESLDILDRVASLVDKSLVVREASEGLARYRLLETVHEYATARLNAAGETDVLLDRHRDWYAAYADAVGLRDYGSLTSRSARCLRSESGNLRAALGRALQQGESAIALRIAARLWGCWWTLGRYEDALRWLGQALDAEEASQTEDRLAAMLGMAGLNEMAGNFTAASQWCEDVCRLADAMGSEAVVPMALTFKAASVLVAGGDAAPFLVDAIERADRLHDQLAAAEALWQLGDTLMVRGEYVAAGRNIDRALALLNSQPDEGARRARYLASRSIAAHLEGEGPHALVTGEEAAILARGGKAYWGSVMGTACAVHGLAIAATGDTDGASALLVEALQYVRQSRHPLADADCLVAFGAAALLRGDTERAGRILGAARAVMIANGGSWRNASTGALYVHYVRTVREALPASVAARVRDEGRAMSRDEAIAYALSSVSSPGRGPAQ